MPSKPFQFRIATLMWLVFVSAMLLGTHRYIRRAYGTTFERLLVATFFASPLIWLFCRPNPFRGRVRVVPRVPRDPPAPIEDRVRQFMTNVTQIEPSCTADSATTLLPEVTEGKAPRRQEEIGFVLRRIQDGVCPSRSGPQ